MPVEPTCRLTPFIASPSVLTGPGCRMKKPDTSLFMLPIQANFVESNLACDAAPPSSGSIATPRPTSAISVPSRGAALKM